MIEMAVGNIKRTVAIRMSPKEDFLNGIKRACENYEIKNGLILTGIGSLKVAKFFDPVELPQKKAGYGYSEAIIKQGPIELISTSGLICNDKDGISLHVHCCFSDSEGNAFAGHLIEGNEVLLTVDMVIAEIDGINMGREFDQDLEVPIFHPKQI